IEDLRERPSQASFPLANVLLALESGAFSPAEDVRASIHQNPEETDPFDLQFLHVESALAGRGSSALRYLRQIAYIKINPGLSRVKADNPLTPAQRRMIKLVQDWGWKPLTLMSLDNITVWNYQQLLEFHHAFAGFCEWAVMVTHKAGDTFDASAKPADRGGLARTITALRTLPGKISGVKPYSRLYYSSAQALFRQQNVAPGKLGWSVLVNVPMARDLDAPTTELTLRQDRFLLPLVLWMTRTGLISPKSLLNVEAAGARMPSKWAQELLDTCVALCKPPGAKAPPDAPRRDGVMFVLAANLNHEFAQDKERKPEPATASTRSGKGSISAPTVVGEAKVFDYEGTGTPVLQDFSLAYANPAGEVFSHHFDFRHHALARVFAFLASRLNYDEAAKKLNVDLLVPPNSQGMNIRLALQLTLFEMTKFFSGSSEHVRRFVTRQRGACYIFEKSPGDNEVRLQICKSVVDLLGRLENTQGMPTRVHIDKQVTGLERLRDLYAHAGVGKINLYVFRETAPHQIHLVDETGAFFSDRVPAETAFGQIGDMVAVLERYAERRGTSLAIFDVSRREGRMIDYVIEPATYADAIRAKRSSPFAIGLREAEPPDGKQHLITIGNATSTAELTADLIAKLSAAAKKAGGASVIDIPDRIEFAGGASVNVQSGARALRGAKAIRNMLLGS
ncbi:MAG: class I adenylate cyclase, partial [Planctomycetaceae bacterium]|nr:class I adenylate cyclase [Planctomycetaceae bacterium]